MEKLITEKHPSKFTQYFARPMSDYQISKSKKIDKKNKETKKHIKSLYQDALDRFSRQKLAKESVFIR